MVEIFMPATFLIVLPYVFKPSFSGISDQILTNMSSPGCRNTFTMLFKATVILFESVFKHGFGILHNSINIVKQCETFVAFNSVGWTRTVIAAKGC